jgi:DNA-directed RNA polymerase specialized sigma24 family protein
MTEGPAVVVAGRDVQEELRFLRTRMVALARGRFPDDLDDIASEAWIRLNRAVQREEPRNAEALMTRIAWRSWVDFCRRKAAQARALGAPIPAEDVATLAATESSEIDPQLLETWRFSVCEWFARHRPGCLETARHVLAGRTWNQASDVAHERPNTLAKRWQRCREQFLAMARKDRGSLGRLLEDLQEFAP